MCDNDVIGSGLRRHSDTSKNVLAPIVVSAAAGQCWSRRRMDTDAHAAPGRAKDLARFKCFPNVASPPPHADLMHKHTPESFWYVSPCTTNNGREVNSKYAVQHGTKCYSTHLYKRSEQVLRLNGSIKTGADFQISMIGPKLIGKLWKLNETCMILSNSQIC